MKFAAASTVALVVFPVSAQCTPTWDTALGNPGIAGGNVSNFTTWDDGTGEKLYAGGSFTNLGGNPLADRIASYDPVTGQWSGLGAGLTPGNTSVYVSDMVAWDDGTGEKLYVSGQFFSAGGLESANSFAAWDGESWADLGAGFTQIDPRVINKILPLDLDGTGEKLYLGGNFENIGDLTGNRGFAVFDGTTYSTVGNGIGLPTGSSSIITDMLLWDDGSGPKIYVSGRFTAIDGWPAINVARFDVAANRWEAFGQVLIPNQPFFSNNALALFDDGTGEALYIGGQEFRINGAGPTLNAAKWDGANWTPVGQEGNGRIIDLEVFDDGTGPALYAAGDAFTEGRNFARLDGDTWVPAAGGVPNQPSTQGNFSAVLGMFPYDNGLLLGGNFTRVGEDGLPARGIAKLTGCDAGPSSPIDLEFRALTPQADLGDTVQIGLFAVGEPGDPAEAVSAVEAIVSWQPANLRLLGVDASNPAGLDASSFPASDGSGLNEASPPADGDGLLVLTAAAGAPVIADDAGTLLAILNFEAVSATSGTIVDLLPAAGSPLRDTTVIDGSTPGQNVTGNLVGATVAIRCGAFDLAQPFGQLDLADLDAFVNAFIGTDLAADQNADGVLDLADVGLFVSGFLGGCVPLP